MSDMFDDWYAIHWILLGVLALLYVVSCARVGMRMAAIGRNGVMWFFITMFLTFIPALVILRRRSKAAASSRMFSDVRRCPHCGEVLTGADAYGDRCPSCRMRLGNGDVA
ncbi:MAG: hypothetical protein ACLFVW_02690 [Phycisphaerae bacterium]